MSKPFFFRIESADLLNFATDPEGEGMSLLRFAKELQKGESEIDFIQDIIDEARNYIEKKKKAGSKGGKAKASSAIAVLGSAVAKASTPLASSSSSTVTELKYKGDFESLWKQYPKKDGKKEAERHFFASVKSREDEDNIILALKNYCVLVQDTERKYIKNGSTWFNNWQDFVEVEDLQQDEYNWVE